MNYFLCIFYRGLDVKKTKKKNVRCSIPYLTMPRYTQDGTQETGAPSQSLCATWMHGHRISPFPPVPHHKQPTQPLTPPPELTEIQHHHPRPNQSFLSFFLLFLCGWLRPPLLLKISNIFFSPFTTRCSADLHAVCLDPSYGLLTKTIPLKDPAPPLFSPLIFP